jgi:hypothetical protein
VKISPSASFLRNAGGSGVAGAWTVSTRTVTDISLALSSGTWTDVSDRVADLPEIGTALEYELGQYATDGIDLKLSDIAYWRTNIFTSAVMSDATKYVEFKITYSVVGAADVIPMFYGFADKDSLEYEERGDTLAVSILTSQDLGFRVASENLTTQYKVYKADGTNDGLRLLNIPGVYIMNVAGTTVEVPVGTHKIAYEWDGLNRTLKFDDGAPVNITTDGYTVLEDSLGHEVLLYIPDWSKVVGPASGTIEDEFVVVVQGTVLPRQWYEQTGVRPLLQKFFSTIGITSVTFGTLTIPTEDGTKKVSFIDNPPEDDSIAGEKGAIASDSSGNLWVAVGHRLYKRTRTTTAYTLMATYTAGDVVRRMHYGFRSTVHEDLWMIVENGSTIKLIVYEIDNNRSWTSLTLTTGGTTAVHWAGTALVNYNYTGSSWKYGLAYTVACTGSDNGFFKDVVKGTFPTLTNTTRFSDLASPQANGLGFSTDFMYVKSGNLVRMQVSFSGGGGYEENSINASGVWVQNGLVIANASFEGAKLAAFHATDDAGAGRVYYYSSGLHGIRSHAGATYTLTDNATFSADPPEDPGSMYYADGKVWFMTVLNSGSPYAPATNRLWSVSGNGTAAIASTGPMNDYGSMVYETIDAKLYGITRNGMLWQHATSLSVYVRRASYPETTATDAIYDVLKSMNLVATISGTKAAYVYRRSDDSGAPEDTGVRWTLTDEDLEDIAELVRKFPRADVVRVTGYSTSTNYNGTSFDVVLLSDARAVELESAAIPDELVRPLAKHLYTFFSIARNIYKFRIGLPYFHYEVFDQAALSLSTTIVPASFGTFYSMTYRPDGAIDAEVLI